MIIDLLHELANLLQESLDDRDGTDIDGMEAVNKEIADAADHLQVVVKDHNHEQIIQQVIVRFTNGPQLEINDVPNRLFQVALESIATFHEPQCGPDELGQIKADVLALQARHLETYRYLFYFLKEYSNDSDLATHAKRAVMNAIAYHDSPEALSVLIASTDAAARREELEKKLAENPNRDRLLELIEASVQLDVEANFTKGGDRQVKGLLELWQEKEDDILEGAKVERSMLRDLREFAEYYHTTRRLGDDEELAAKTWADQRTKELDHMIEQAEKQKDLSSGKLPEHDDIEPVEVDD